MNKNLKDLVKSVKQCDRTAKQIYKKFDELVKDYKDFIIENQVFFASFSLCLERKVSKSTREFQLISRNIGAISSRLNEIKNKFLSLTDYKVNTILSEIATTKLGLEQYLFAPKVDTLSGSQKKGITTSRKLLVEHQKELTLNRAKSNNYVLEIGDFASSINKFNNKYAITK